MSEGNEEDAKIEFLVIEPVDYEPHRFYHVYGPLTDRQRAILRENYDDDVSVEYVYMRTRTLLNMDHYAPQKFPSEEKRAEWLRQEKEAQENAIAEDQIVWTHHPWLDYPVLVIEL